MLVTKETAVFKAISNGIPGRPRLNGSHPWPTRTRNSTRMETAEKASTASR